MKQETKTSVKKPCPCCGKPTELRGPRLDGSTHVTCGHCQALFFVRNEDVGALAPEAQYKDGVWLA